MFEKRNNNEIQQDQINLVAKKQLLEKYKASEIIEIADDIYWMKDKEYWNINNFVNKKWELLFNVVWIIKDLWVDKYKWLLKNLWYKWYVSQNWYYHMLEIKTWKEIPQESLKYYEIFETLWNIQYRDYLSDVIYQKWLKEEWKKLKKMPNLREQMDEVIFPELEKMSRFYVLRPVELILFKQYWIIEEEHFKELKKKVYSFEYIKKLIEDPVWDYVEWEIKIKKINWKIYKINTNQVTEDELKLYLDLNIINKEDYELLKDILEKRMLKQEKKEHIEKTRKHISELENEVTNNLW